MSVITYNTFNENEVADERYVGCVLDTYEHNGYEDSDFYAICWDEEEQKVVRVCYDTTRFWGYGRADIDATLEVLRKVYRYYYNSGRKKFDSDWKFAQAKKVLKGDTVKVVRGRKIPQGTVGNVFWIGERYNIYSKKYEDRVGIDVDGERLFLPLNYVEVIGWENRVSSGFDRKRRLRNHAIASLPIQYRKIFETGLLFRKEAVYV